MDEAQDRILAVNASAGELVGVPVDQVALQTSATAAWRRAFGSIPLRAGDRILTTRAEYASNVLPMLQASRRVGAGIMASAGRFHRRARMSLGAAQPCEL